MSEISVLRIVMLSYAQAFCPGTRSVTAMFTPLVSIGIFEIRYPSMSNCLSVGVPGRKLTCELVYVLYPVNVDTGGTARFIGVAAAAYRLVVGTNCLAIDGLLQRSCATALPSIT